MQERPGFHDTVDFLTGLANFKPVDGFQRGFCLTISRPEAGEIMITDQPVSPGL